MEKNKVNQKKHLRPVLSYSEQFRREVVKRIENNRITVAQAAREYGTSRTSVYNWIYKYSTLYSKGYRQIVEPMSSTKRIETMKERIRELERIVGQKQIELDFLNKLIDIAEEEFGVEIKKKRGSGPSTGSGKTAKD